MTYCVIKTPKKASAAARTPSLFDGLRDLERPDFLGRDGLPRAKKRRQRTAKAAGATSTMTQWREVNGVRQFGDCTLRCVGHTDMWLWRAELNGIVLCEGEHAECVRVCEEVGQ
jgi:hypothetical protein